MTQVDYFKVQVSYSGSFEEIEEQEWRQKAQAKMDRGIDAYDHTDLLDDDKASREAGCLWIRNAFPSNRIAEVCWAECRQEEE